MIALSIALSKPLPIHRDMRQRPETETETGKQKQKQKKETEILRPPLRGAALEKGRLALPSASPATPCEHEESMKKETEKTASRKRAPAKPKAAAPARYVMTPEDAQAMKPLLESNELPELELSGNTVSVKHLSQSVGMAHIARAMGIEDQELYNLAIWQLVNVASKDGQCDARSLNMAVAIVRSIAPRDHLEVLLALQMAAIHLASISHVRMMNNTQTIPQLDIQERTVNKLMRTFTTQMEALRKHRNGGNQRVTVKHVHVHEGGQAIVGNVSHGGGSISKKPRQSHEEREDDDLPLSVRAALHGNIEEDREPVRVASGEVQEGMSFPWSKSGRS